MELRLAVLVLALALTAEGFSIGAFRPATGGAGVGPRCSSRAGTSGKGPRSVCLWSSEESTESESAPEKKTPTVDDFPLEPPPSTFVQCITQAQIASKRAFEEGFKLVEVEFPPVSQDFLDDTGSSAYDISKANTRLAIDFAKKFSYDEKMKVSIILPDETELDIATEIEKTNEPFPGVKLATLRESGARTADSIDSLVTGLFGSRFGGKGNLKVVPDTDLYVAIVYSCQEMPDLETLHQLEPDKPIVFFNLGLETMRGDLGLPGFPRKDLHFRFMSKIKPAYLLRTRTYSRSINRAPFLVNYQGALFRVFPGGYQTMLDVGERYKRITASLTRPPLGEFKDQLTDALVINGEKVVQDETKTMSFFRKGYKSRTWWEADDLEDSDMWRT